MTLDDLRAINILYARYMRARNRGNDTELASHERVNAGFEMQELCLRLQKMGVELDSNHTPRSAT